MIKHLIRTFIDAPILALIFAGVIAVIGLRALRDNPKDAIPDIAENQTIVFSEWMGRSPKDVDEQVTYPLSVALQGVPNVKEIRATSGFGWSIVYVVFESGVDFYWARSRVLERLNVAQGQLPEGVTPRLGPDATALGQVLWYTVENGWYSPERPGLRFTDDGLLTSASKRKVLQTDPELAESLEQAEPFTDPITGEPLVFSKLPLDRLRSLQDFYVKLALESVAGVSEVASIGGYVRQYQIDVDPEAMRAFGAPLSRLVSAVRSANIDVGAKVIEENGTEVLIRGIGFLGGKDRGSEDRETRERAVIRDLENVVIHADDGTPVYLKQVADVTTGPDFRRGALDKMGAEAVGGCVTMRFGENPLTVIDRVHSRVDALEAGLPPGVRIDAFYDRTDLISETNATLAEALSLEVIITIVAALLFLLHLRSSVVIAATLPLAVLLAFIGMQTLGLSSNIMSLAGIAIAIGTMVDMAIIMLENIYQALTDERDQYIRIEKDENGLQVERIDKDARRALIRDAAYEVGPAILTAVSTTVISFLPVFFLEGQAAKLFTPLAWTKTFCMVGAVILALTVVPPLASLMLRSRGVRTSAAAIVATIVALTVGLGIQFASSIHPALGDWVELASDKTRLLIWAMAILFGAAAGALTFLLLRERVRSIEENPISKLIHRAYEPVLRLVLRNKTTFLCLPMVLVAWGLAIWLGKGPIIRTAIYPLELLGFAPTEWTAATIIALVGGLVLGAFLVPLAIDTVVVGRGLRASGSAPTSRHHPVIKTVVGIAVFGLCAAFGDRLIESNSGPLARASFSLPDGTTLGQYAPLAAWLEDSGIGQEFMPPLDEGDFLYMPSVLPAGSINTVMDVMQKQDVQFAQIPEVDVVVGKLGRIESPLDPAPVGMLETMIMLKPKNEWPVIEDDEFGKAKRRRSMAEIWEDIKKAGSFPGVLPSVQLQPIRTRVEMLSTGLNANIGLKIYGDSVTRGEEVAIEIEKLLRDRLQNAQAINAIRLSGKPYLEFRIDREAIARHGVNVADVQQIIEVAVGGKNLTTTYEGLDRYPVRIRYARELRDEVPDLERILVPTPTGAQIPIGQLADIQRVTGPMSVRREGAKYVSYVTMAAEGIDETNLVANAQRIIDEAIVSGELDLPDGYSLDWAGSFERNRRAKKRLAILIPLVLLTNLLLIYLQFKRWPLAIVIFFAIPVALSGGFILIEAWPTIQNALFAAGLMNQPFAGDAVYLTVAVWVGFIALFGIAVDDGIVIGTYLDQTFSKSPIRSYEEIEERVVHAGLRRIRPALMTTFTTLAALVPVLLSTGRGSDVMTPMALPVFGGMLVALVTILVVPTCYCAIKQTKWKLGLPDRDFDPQ